MSDQETRLTLGAALMTSVVLIAFQTAAKATRDALFLSYWDVTSLPVMVIAASFASLALAYMFSWLMPVVGPTRLVPGTLGVSAGLLAGEWALLPSAPQAASVLVYLHYAGLGALLISGFWSIISERFDPRSAKRYVGRVAAGGTVGGVVGGLLAERVGAVLSVATMLPILGGLHLTAALFIALSPLGRPRGAQRTPPRRDSETSGASGLRAISEAPYLQNLVVLVFLVTISEMLIDYVFKVRADEAFAGGEGLLRFFALFYTGVSIITVLLQAAGARAAVQKLGLARTVGLMPGVTALGSTAAIAVPGLLSAGLARGSEIVLRNSLYRAGYELLFSPLAPRDKRATKSLVDVGVVRIGDIAGGLLVQGILVLGAVALNMMLGLAIAVSLLALYLAKRLHDGYVATLESSLIAQASSLEELDDAATRTAILQTVGAMDLRELFGPSATRPSLPRTASVEGVPEVGAAGPGTISDPALARIVDLRSRDPERVRAALAADSLGSGELPFAVQLLSWNDVALDAIHALRDAGPRNVGLLVDHLLDPSEDFAVRRRIPLVLAELATERAVYGLLQGLEDTRFEVRYRCGRALHHARSRDPNLHIERRRVIDVVLTEVAVDDGVWRSRRLLDQMDDEDWSPVMDQLLIDRANRSLEHVFTLLSLIMPPQPLKIAFRGLHTNDKMLRGTALEYLETSLPSEVKMALWPFLEDDRRSKMPERATRDVVDELLQSNQSIVLNLEELRRQSGERSFGREGDGD